MSAERVVSGDWDFLDGVDRTGWKCEAEPKACGGCEKCEAAAEVELHRLIGDEGVALINWARGVN